MFRFGHMGYMPWGGSFMMIIWVVLIAAVIYFLVNNNRNNRSGYDDRHDNYRKERYIEDKKSDRAEEVAKERYANGEISREELEEILRTLRNNS